MAKRNLDRSLTAIFGHEGGFTKARTDPGNWTGGAIGSGLLKGTKYGIAAHSYPDLDIANLTLADAAEIYRRDYAAKVAYDDLPPGVDHAVLDFAINSGPTRAAKFLQEIVGTEIDGKVGPATVKATRALNAPDVINQLCDDRLAFMRGLRIWPTYKNGWTRRVADVRAFSLKLAAEEQPPHSPPASRPLRGMAGRSHQGGAGAVQEVVASEAGRYSGLSRPCCGPCSTGASWAVTI